MPTLLDNHRVYTASIFKDTLSDQNSANVYFTFGKSTPWSNEASPDIANTSPVQMTEIWNQMIGAKKITGNDIMHCVPRYDWKVNTVYTEYDQNSSELGQDGVQFYVLTTDFNVFKCIYNNNGANSTIQPTSTNPAMITQTADGYIWKFMYSIPTSERIRFTTATFMPVKKLKVDDGSLQWDVQEQATDGAIYAIKLLTGGTNYSNTSNLVVTINGNGSGATASANIDTNTNMVHTITLTDYGFGYSNASVIISGGGGSGTTAKALIGPPGGHGSNPLYELVGKSLMINPRVINTESGVLSVENEFRQVAILANPLKYSDGVAASENAYSQTLDLSVSGIGADYVEDEYVYQGPSLNQATFYGKVVEYDNINMMVRLTNTQGNPISDPLIGTVSASSKYVTSINYPDLRLNSGQFLYVDNIKPIIRNINQTEYFKIRIKF